MNTLFRSIIIAAVFILLWQCITIIFSLPPYILPAPILVFKSFQNYGLLILEQSVPTIIEAITGFILSIFISVFSAITLSYFRPMRAWFFPILLISQALPTFAIAPLLVIWFGYGLASKIATTVLMLFFPITSSFYDGLQNTPQEYLDLAQTMRATKFSILLNIRIPLALPSLASGLRVAATFAPIGAVVGEWVGSSKGLGFLILNANSKMQIDLMFAALFVLIFLTVLFYFSVDFLSKKLTPWQKK